MDCLCPTDRPWALRLAFDNPPELTENLRGADTLYNTYWIRFEREESTFDRVVANTRTLLDCAKAAGVRRAVHLSVTKPSLDSPLPYFRGKALLEQAVAESGFSYAIVRPTVLFGNHPDPAAGAPATDREIMLRTGGDSLSNNIAWMLRRLPIFAVAGDGEYRLQPVFVGDVAKVAVDAAHREGNEVLDVAGPETYTYTGLIRLLSATLRRRCWVMHLAPRQVLCLAQMLGRMVDDVVLTREELEGLMADLLVSDSPPLGTVRLSEWLEESRDTLGKYWHSELARHWGRR